MCKTFNIKSILLCTSLLSIIPFKSHALACDYTTADNMMITSIQVEHRNYNLWIRAVAENGHSTLFRATIGGYSSDSMLLNVAQASLLFGHKVSICYYDYSNEYKELYNLELRN